MCDCLVVASRCLLFVWMLLCIDFCLIPYGGGLVRVCFVLLCLWCMFSADLTLGLVLSADVGFSFAWFDYRLVLCYACYAC